MFVIGGDAFTGGIAYEALDSATRLEKNFIAVLNDDNMSTSENVGGTSRYLSSIHTGMGYNDLKENITNTLEKVPVLDEKVIDRISRTKQGIKQLVIPGVLFEDMDPVYLEPVDGHGTK